MQLGDEDWTVRVLSAQTGNPLKVFQIGQDSVVEGIKNEEFYIEVEVPIHHHSKFLLRDNATQLNATVKIDGTTIGVTRSLTAFSPKNVFTYSLVSGLKCALVFVEPTAIPFENEAEAKLNIEKNKASTVGTIVVDIWTSTAGSRKKSSGRSAAIAKPAVPETKKFYEMPSLGICKERVLGPNNKTCTRTNRINKIGTKTIKVQTSLMIDLLVRLQLQKEMEIRNQQNPPQASIAAAFSSVSEPSSKKQRKGDKDKAVDAPKEPKERILIDLT